MKIRLLAVGPLRERYITDAADEFRVRLRRYGRFEEAEVAASHGRDPAQAMIEEGERILRALEPGEPLWLLERTGTQLSSIALAQNLTDVANAGAGRLTIAIGGTFGASRALLARADFLWSLSELTFLHEWARAIVLEQLYRAAKIARNEPYHH